MIFRFFVCICILFGYLSVEVFSQIQNQEKLENADAAFDLAAAKHKLELRNLLTTRGLSLQIRDASSKSIARLLGTRSNPYSNEAGYPENTALLFYSFENDILSVWLIDEKGIKAESKRKVSEQELFDSISALRNSLGVKSLQVASAPRQLLHGEQSIDKTPKLPFDTAISNITDILVPASVAKQLLDVKQLIVVPVLAIGTVPFAILRPFKNDSFLIDKMSITIAPGLFDIGQSIEPWESDFSSPLVVGNPYLPIDSKWKVPALPGAESEALEVAKLFNAKALVGRLATKQNIQTRAPVADLLYFASHGVADSENPLTGGFLLLSADEFEKGWWTAKEIQGLRLGAKMAVLSACQTGLGRVHDAGIIGLARAFQIAGVPRVVMSLWSVNDAATNDLMRSFMKNLSGPDKNTPSEALRQAMLEVKKQRPEPSQWASFVVFGTPR